MPFGTQCQPAYLGSARKVAGIGGTFSTDFAGKVAGLYVTVRWCTPRRPATSIPGSPPAWARHWRIIVIRYCFWPRLPACMGATKVVDHNDPPPSARLPACMGATLANRLDQADQASRRHLCQNGRPRMPQDGRSGCRPTPDTPVRWCRWCRWWRRHVRHRWHGLIESVVACGGGGVGADQMAWGGSTATRERWQR